MEYRAEVLSVFSKRDSFPARHVAYAQTSRNFPPSFRNAGASRPHFGQIDVDRLATLIDPLSLFSRQILAIHIGYSCSFVIPMNFSSRRSEDRKARAILKIQRSLINREIIREIAKPRMLSWSRIRGKSSFLSRPDALSTKRYSESNIHKSPSPQASLSRFWRYVNPLLR